MRACPLLRRPAAFAWIGGLACLAAVAELPAHEPGGAPPAAAEDQELPPPLGVAEPRERITVEAQPRPRMAPERFEMPVFEVPVDPPSVPARDAELDDRELVLGVVLDGEAVAYPIRYLALYEVVNDRVGRVSLAPSW